ncbi:MAG: hypothetical protein V6Z82_04170 [Flavobacteriales bacterium]
MAAGSLIAVLLVAPFVQGVDLVITGEGRTDGQTLSVSLYECIWLWH